MHVIDQSKCLKCGECERTCKFNAIEKKIGGYMINLNANGKAVQVLARQFWTPQKDKYTDSHTLSFTSLQPWASCEYLYRKGLRERTV